MMALRIIVFLILHKIGISNTFIALSFELTNKHILFYSIEFYSILFYSILYTVNTTPKLPQQIVLRSYMWVCCGSGCCRTSVDKLFPCNLSSS